MRSAIPVVLLSIIVNWSEGKQGSGLKGDEVLKNSGGEGLRSERADLRSERADLRPESRFEV